MKVVLYGTCSFPYFFRELVQVANEKKMGVDWRPLVLSWRHIDLYKGIVPLENLKYIHPGINRLMKEKFLDLSILKNYPGSIFKDIRTDKNAPGMLRRQTNEYQIQNALAYYRFYKDYLLKEKPDAVFIPMVETHEGIILFKTALELGIKTISHNTSRNLELSILSQTPYEDVPEHAFAEPVPTSLVERAEKYLDGFSKKQNAAFSIRRYEPLEEEIIVYGRPVPSYKKIWKLPKVILNLVKDQILEPHSGRANPFWFQFLIQLWRVNKIIWHVKGEARRRYFDIKSLARLPERFIYFPLHMSPELSVTTYAPYFEDQMRAIDLILLNMPSDCWLAVKEHPGMKGMRPASFYRELRRKAGVLLVDYDVPSIELIQRSILTVVISGTAALEALFLGKPALALGASYFSPWVTRLDSFPNLGQVIRDAVRQSPAEIRSKATDLIARIFMVGYDYIFVDPHDVGHDWKYMMNRRNVNSFLDAFMDHLCRIRL